MILRSLVALLACQFAPMWAGISPTVAEVNLGPIPIDLYTSQNNGNAYFPSCPSGNTVRQCVQYFVKTGPNNYVGQGITGVAIYFGVGGGDYSTTWDNLGNVEAAWTNNLRTLLSDLKSWGIQRVTLRMNLYGWGETLGQVSSIPDCSGTTTLKFYPWIPYGFLNSNGYTDCQGNNGAYSGANSNTFNFWGWGPFFNLINQMLQTTKNTGINLEEFVFLDEINLWDFPVEARMIYDNTHQTDVLDIVRYYMSYYGFDPLSLTYSAYAVNASLSGFDCGTYWGDAATLYDISPLAGALAGGNGEFGYPGPQGLQIENNLQCQNVNGYMASSLYSNAASRTTLRPWNDPADYTGCFKAPTLIANPSGVP